MAMIEQIEIRLAGKPHDRAILEQFSCCWPVP
jgi:hypothetical protein